MFCKIKAFLPFLLASFLLLGSGFNATYAGDSIDIDLGGSKNATTATTPVAPSPVVTKSKDLITPAQNNENHNQASNSKSFISKITLASKENSLILTFGGKNLSEPQVTKNSDGKVLIKFSDTQLSIKPLIKPDNPIITSIRSSDHNGTAWVVLDNNGLNNWSISKNTENICINFSTVLSANNREVVHDVQHRHRDDHREEEPVRHVNVRLLAFHERADEDEQIGDPDDGQPQVDIPLGLRIFAALRDAEHVARRGHDQEKLVAPEYEPGQEAPPQPRLRCALHNVKGRCKQRVASESEDHRGRVNRAQPPEIRPRQI